MKTNPQQPRQPDFSSAPDLRRGKHHCLVGVWSSRHRLAAAVLAGLLSATQLAWPQASAAEALDPADAGAVLQAAIEALVEAQQEELISPDQEALEAALAATLENATMIGRWHPVADGEVGEERTDEYRIAGANKISGNRWVVRARLRDDMPNLVIPVPLRVEWAGDTPVLVVDNFGLPGMNRYSARVLIHDDTYAGSWSGGGIAGLISGVIVREPVDAEPEPAEGLDIPPDAPQSAPRPEAEIDLPPEADEI